MNKIEKLININMIPFRQNRSYRRFFQSEEISEEQLKMMVEAARLSPSSRNIQPIKFYICNDQEKNSEIFPNLAGPGILKIGRDLLRERDHLLILSFFMTPLLLLHIHVIMAYLLKAFCFRL